MAGEKVDKISFKTMVMASNPKATEVQVTLLWSNYQTTGILPKEFTALLPSSDNKTSPSCIFPNAPAKTNYSLGVEIPTGKPQPTSPPKTYSRAQEKELRQGALNYLVASTTEANKSFQKQLSENGVLGTMSDGFKIMLNAPVKLVTGEKYFTEERDTAKLLADEEQGVKKLQNTKLEKGAFEFEFQKERGVEFKPENIEKFNKQSQQFLKVNAYKEKYEALTSDLKGLEVNLLDSRRANKLEASTFLADSSKKDFDAKLVKALDKFCGGNEKLRNEYLKKISSGSGGSEANIVQTLKKVQAETAKAYKKELGGKDFSYYEKAYNNSLKTAFGEKNSKAMAQAYMQSQKQGIMYTEMGLTIATTLLLPGSSLIARGSATLAREVGADVAGHVVKGAFTLGAGVLPSGMHVANALTSEAGVTAEAKAEAKQSLKMGVTFGAIGGYISAPLGEFVSGLVKANPAVISNAVGSAFANAASKVTGFATEVSADSFLQAVINHDDMSSALKQNGSMQAVMRMLVGGQAARAAEGYKVSESVVEGVKTYSVMDKSGKVLGKTTNPNELFAGLLGAMDPKGEVNFKGKVLKSKPNPFEAKFEQTTVDPKKFGLNLAPEVKSNMEANVTSLYSKTKEFTKPIVEQFKKTFGDIEGVEIQQRVKDKDAMHEKSYRRYKKATSRIKELEETLKTETSPEEIAKIKKEIVNKNQYMKDLETNYPELSMALGDSFGQRIIMNKPTPQNIEKTVQKIISDIKRGDYVVTELENYAVNKDSFYYNESQVARIKAACKGKGVELKYSEGFKDSGYTTTQMNLTYKNGVNAELQVRGSEVHNLAESEHILYDIREGKDMAKGNAQIENLLNPVYDAVKQLDADKGLKKDYDKYLKDYYQYKRDIELGLNPKAPELDAKIPQELNMDNIIRLNNLLHQK